MELHPHQHMQVNIGCVCRNVSAELYGPLILALTLVTVLFYGLKSTGEHMVYMCICMYTVSCEHVKLGCHFKIQL